jgi:cell division ATPase FtsA
VVEGLFRTGEATGLKLQLVDVSPAALCNAFRFNYGDLEGCTMLLDIGAKTSNLLFFEKGKVYARGINIGANSITQDFGAESKLRFAEAERIKIAEGFVSLGGAYEEPENPHQAAISKIARQVMTRLHIQVNQTIQFYRGQQGGSAPQRLFLAGGASVMPYTAQFFAEKLNVPVEYFNPFRNVQLDPSIDLEELAKVAHSFGEVVGLGLRNMAQCPVELNLVPKSIRKRQQLDQKKPYFIAAIFSLVLVVFAYGWFYDRVANIKAAALTEIETELQPLQTSLAQLEQHEARIQRTKSELDAFTGWINQRFFWADLLGELREILLTVERDLARPGVHVGVWLESLGNVAAGSISISQPEFAEEPAAPNPYAMDPILAARYGLIPRAPAPDPDAAPVRAGRAGAAGSSTNGVINATFRAVNLNRGGDRSANGDLAYEVERSLRSSKFFDPAGTKLSDELEQVDEDAVSFTFGVTLKLKETGSQ